MQGLPDHAHVPTLQRLPKDLPVVASPAGANVAEGLGFQNITALDHGEETTVGGGKLKIRATAGVQYHDHRDHFSDSVEAEGRGMAFLSCKNKLLMCGFPLVMAAVIAHSVASHDDQSARNCVIVVLGSFPDERLIRLCAGALVGPPWSKRENGFVFTEQVPEGISLYYEPHCDYDESSLAGIDSADIVITPCVNQELLNYPLVGVLSSGT